MALQVIWPTLAILSLVGAGVGTHLGRSAIAEINPSHFRADERPSRFHADLTPHMRRDWGGVQVRELRAAEQGIAATPACIGCRTYPEEYFPVHEAAVEKPETGWAAVEAEAVAPQPAVELASVDRYAHFQVEAAAPEPAERPATVTYAALEQPAE